MNSPGVGSPPISLCLSGWSDGKYDLKARNGGLVMTTSTESGSSEASTS